MGQNATILSNDAPLAIDTVSECDNTITNKTANKSGNSISSSNMKNSSISNSEAQKVVKLLKIQTKARERRKIEKQISKYATKIIKLPKNMKQFTKIAQNRGTLALQHYGHKHNSTNNTNNSNDNNEHYSKEMNGNFNIMSDICLMSIKCESDSMQLKLLNKNWKLSLYFILYNSDLINDLEIPFDILNLIIENCEGTMRQCDICDRHVLDLRYTKGYGCSQDKNEMKKYKLVVCNYCHTQVAASYQRVDKNLEAMGMRLRYD